MKPGLQVTLPLSPKQRKTATQADSRIITAGPEDAAEAE
jgi:hypothetical protein